MTTATSRIRARKKLLIGVVVAVLVGIGFSQLPLRTQGRIVEFCTFGNWPLEWAVRRQFSRKQPELRAIIDFVNDVPEITGLSLSADGLRTSLQSDKTEVHDLDQTNILHALMSIDAKLVKVDDDRVSVFLGSEVRGSSSFEMSYIYPSSAIDVADCESVTARVRDNIGACAFQLSRQWFALYQWYPSDLDELEKAIDRSN